ncbi:MAG TPA: hypothetical protein VK694_07365 [Verrucomicrobiae bacterium]|nr:hypothetical protein [Verrucomicrobiae bacterium]
MEDDRYMPSEVSLPPVIPEASEDFSDVADYYSGAQPESEINLEKNVSVNELVTEGVKKQPEVVGYRILSAADRGEPEALRQERRQEVRQDEVAQGYASQVGDIAAGAPLRQPGLQGFTPPQAAPPLTLSGSMPAPSQGSSYVSTPSLYRKSIVRGFVAGIIVLVCAALVLLIA